MADSSEAERMRIDTWLWVARFVKTRALAVDAISGGHVQINGVRVKPSKGVGPGDRVSITIGQDRFLVDVVALARRRGPASEAVLLYEERPEDRERRESAAEQRRLAFPAAQDIGGRPTKRERRRYDAARGRDRR